VLVMHPRNPGLMSGEKARQLIRRHQKVDGGNDEQDDAEQGQDKFHGGFLEDKIEGRLTSPTAASEPVYRLPAAPRKCSGDTMLDRVRSQSKMIFLIEAGILIYKHAYLI
jgi:hypothetical protein